MNGRQVAEGKGKWNGRQGARRTVSGTEYDKLAANGKRNGVRQGGRRKWNEKRLARGKRTP